MQNNGQPVRYGLQGSQSGPTMNFGAYPGAQARPNNPPPPTSAPPQYRTDSQPQPLGGYGAPPPFTAQPSYDPQPQYGAQHYGAPQQYGGQQQPAFASPLGAQPSYGSYPGTSPTSTEPYGQAPAPLGTASSGVYQAPPPAQYSPPAPQPAYHEQYPPPAAPPAHQGHHQPSQSSPQSPPPEQGNQPPASASNRPVSQPVAAPAARPVSSAHETRPSTAATTDAALVAARTNEDPSLPGWLQKVPKVKKFDHAKKMKEMIDAGETTAELVEKAQNEHVHKMMPFSASKPELIEEYGEGTVYFFDFIKFVVIANIVLVIFQAINYIVFAADEKPSFSSRNQTNPFQGFREGYTDFFITGYNSGHKPAWLALNILSVIYCVFAAPLYYFIMRCRVDPNVEDQEAEDKILRYEDDGRIDVSSYYRSNGNLLGRRVLSVVIFLLLIGVQILGSWFITKRSTPDLGTSFGIAILVAVLNVIYTFIARITTQFERWFTFGPWKKSLTIKLILFKLANIVTVYAAKDYKTLSEGRCVYDVIGEQFIAILIIEMLFMNIYELLYTAFHGKYFHRYASLVGSITGDYDNLPQFDLSNEYLTVIYRQYLAILSMVVFPLSIAFCVVGFAFQFFVGKVRLFKICGKPRRISHSQKAFLAGILALIAVVAFVTPFAGDLWIMTGWTRDQSDFCYFP